MTKLSVLLPDGYIDAHHHIWAPVSGASRIGYRWLRDIGAPKPFGDPTPIQRDYLIDEFLAEADTPPKASVHVQTDGALPDPVAETAWVQEQADRAGHPVAIVGAADLAAPDLADLLSRHGAYRSFVGVRQIVARLPERPELSFAPRDLLADPAWCDGLKILESKGLSFDLQLYPEQAWQAMEALAATPALRVVIDHALSPYDQMPSGFARWKEAVHAMAERPNTWIKLSGFGMYDPAWTGTTAPMTDRLVAETLRAFGPERVMWGSNYPVEKLAVRYEDAVTCVVHAVAAVSEDAASDVFMKTASRAYGPILT